MVVKRIATEDKRREIREEKSLEDRIKKLEDKIMTLENKIRIMLEDINKAKQTGEK